MKLLIATDAWSPQTNGVVTTFRQVIPELEALGAETTVVHPEIFKTVPLPGYPEIRVVRNPWAVAGHLDNLEFDAIHIATEGPLGLAARRWCQRAGHRFTTSLHTKFPEYVSQRTGLPVKWGYSFLRWFHAPASTTLITTRTQARELTAWGMKNLTVWGRGVNTQLFRPKCRTSHDSEHHAEQNPHAEAEGACKQPVLLYVGRVAVEKNLEAFLSLEIDGEKWIVGDGPQRGELEERYPEVRWLGYQYGAELAHYYGKADVFVFPSRTDTFGLVMLEAMACGTPVAAYPVTGPIDVVQPGVTGVLDDDLSSAIAGALQLSRAACRSYAETQSWRIVAERLLSATLATCPGAPATSSRGTFQE